MQENSFTLKKASSRYPTETITAVDSTDDLVLYANIPAQPKFLLHSLEQTARGIGLYMNADKTEFMHLNQDSAISSLNSKPMKLVDQFVYLGSNISSTEIDVNIHLSKTWTAIHRSSTMWKSDLSDKIKLGFFQAVALSVLLYGCTTWTLAKCLEKKLCRLHEDAVCCFEQILKAALYKTAAVQLTNHPRKISKTCRALRMNSHTTFSYELTNASQPTKT